MCFLSTVKLVPNKIFILYFQQKNGVCSGIICQMKGLSHGLLYIVLTGQQQIDSNFQLNSIPAMLQVNWYRTFYHVCEK